MANTLITDCSESSEATHTTAASTLAPSEILPSSPGKYASEKVDYGYGAPVMEAVDYGYGTSYSRLDESTAVRVPEEDADLYSSTVARFESTISKNIRHGTSSGSLMSNIAASPAVGKGPSARRHSRVTTKNMKGKKIANNDFHVSNVPASPVTRPSSRRHSLMMAKHIEDEKIANDKF
jgi:hypothetical protein